MIIHRRLRRQVKLSVRASIFVAIGCILVALSHFSINSEIFRQSFYSLTNDYFRLALLETKGGLLIDTPKCKLPAFDTFGVGVRKLVMPYYYSNYYYSDCSENVRFTHIENQKLVINETELRLRGYSFQNVSCCYRTISRVEQDLEEFSIYADRGFKYSFNCYPMNLTTEPMSGFIEVKCTGPDRNGIQRGTIYQNFHAFPKFSNTEGKINAKMSFWSRYAESMKNSNFSSMAPPSVLLLGIDSTSRLHFRRFMNKTRKLLEKIGGTEMKGYTKIGDNTCENIFPVLVSFTHGLDKVANICMTGNQEAMDDHDFLWKHFSRENYVTGHLEDFPLISIFNNKKPGFVKAPTDLYIRPWMLAAYSEKEEGYPCLGYQRADEMLYQYTYDSVTWLHANKTPYFLITWITELTHSYISGLQALDDPLSEMIGTMYRKGMLENTVLIVMGDHGYRSGAIRDTTSGWFENNLPLLNIRLPESLKKRFPEWQGALERNSHVLTSHFDLHETLKDILRLSSPNALHVTEPLGQSLFTKIPFRNCTEANIPSEYCVCLPYNRQPTVNNKVVQYCVEEVINKINKDLPGHCAKLSLDRIKAVTIKNIRKKETVGTIDYSIRFDARPSDFQFEALARYDNNTGKVIKIPKVQRTNRKTQNASCLRNHEAHLELFCTCL